MISPVYVYIYHLGVRSKGLYYLYKCGISNGVACKSYIDQVEYTYTQYRDDVLRKSAFESVADILAHIKIENDKAIEAIKRLPPDHNPDESYTPYTMEYYPHMTIDTIEELIQI